MLFISTPIDFGLIILLSKPEKFLPEKLSDKCDSLLPGFMLATARSGKRKLDFE
jgi:hypothetical protein